ncbi:hypothetical protein [Chitinophaga filiformis]|uniref:Uncharacterized protein n=1 Tax=Chitinophaga filiformis TaxID=104663 RepID=A0ABY4I2Q1_CHIFI|nr:hypothetical protein [Chitinophaga filiformis]UPK69539.1 hypothetical protein MYF79_31750 [Chitinophaga filiformis]
MKSNITTTIYASAYVALAAIFFLNMSLINSRGEDAKELALPTLLVILVYAVLITCDLNAKKYISIVYNSVIVAALLSMHSRTVSTILMAIILSAGLVTALILVYVNNKERRY